MKNGIFANPKYFIIDMDGTFYLDGNILEGSIEFIEKARHHCKNCTELNHIDV